MRQYRVWFIDITNNQVSEQTDWMSYSKARSYIDKSSRSLLVATSLPTDTAVKAKFLP